MDQVGNIPDSSYGTLGWDKLPTVTDVRAKVNTRLTRLGPVQEKVQSIENSIIRANGLSDLGYEFFVYAAKGVFIMHAQNRKIFFPLGLIQLTRNDDEIAFIIAHEIAHWEEKDFVGDKIRIPVSSGSANESECNADERAKKLMEKAGFSGQKIQRIVKMTGRDVLCRNTDIGMPAE